MNTKKSANEGTRTGVLTAHAREKDDKKISRRGADANEGMSIEQGGKGREREGMGRARGKDQSWTLCEHRGGEEAEDVLSRIIPKFGGSGIPDAAAAVSTREWVGLQTKRGLVLHLASAPAGYEGTGAGAGCLGSSLESSGDQYHLFHLFAVYFGVCLMSDSRGGQHM